MSRFRVGKYDRAKLGILKPLAPIQSVRALIDVTPEDLLLAGKKLLLVDVDNTLIAWGSERIPESTMTWLGFMKSSGLKVCIISNTKRVARLERLAQEMEIPFLRGRFKPSRRMYLKALEQFGVQASEAVMVGDQLFTDILGANRSRIDAIWVQQMAPRDFIGTKLSRLGERLIRSRLHKAMTEETQKEGAIEELPFSGGSAAIVLLNHPTVRQFVKFCIVGGLSTVIDLGLFWILRFSDKQQLSLHLGNSLIGAFPWLFRSYTNKPADASAPILRTVTASIAIVNSFVWNRRWTFSIRGKEHRRAQLKKFIVVSVVGLLLNVVITAAVLAVLPLPTAREGAYISREAIEHVEKAQNSIALAVSTVLVAFWNFLGQKYWTFNPKH